jgi:NitT/TauT family transport system permease protein
MSIASRRARNSALLIAVLLAIWQLVYWYVGDVALRSPLQTVIYIAELFKDVDFWSNALETLKAFVLALAIAVAIGLGLGLWFGFHRLSGEIFTPILISIAAVPKITLYPIILLAFGIGFSAKVAFGALHGIAPIAIFTIGAIANVKPVLLKVGRVSKLGPFEVIRSILLPAALPEIFSGLRLGFSSTLIGTVLGEMFAAQFGLGFMLMKSIGLHNVDLIMALTLILTVFAAGFSAYLLSIDRRLRRRMA